MRVKNILLVEDSSYDVELILAALKPYRFINQIDLARDGSEALDYLFRRNQFADRSQDNPVLILLDLKMPKVDGIEVLRQVRASPVLKLIPVVMFTSSREQQDIAGSYKLGVNAYISKPVDFAKFSDAVRQIGLFWALMNELPAS